MYEPLNSSFPSVQAIALLNTPSLDRL